MKRIFIYLAMAFCFIYSNAYLVDKAYYNYADSLKKSSDTIVYRLMEKEAIKRDLNDNTAPLVYMRPGYSVQIPVLQSCIHTTCLAKDRRMSCPKAALWRLHLQTNSTIRTEMT